MSARKSDKFNTATVIPLGRPALPIDAELARPHPEDIPAAQSVEDGTVENPDEQVEPDEVEHAEADRPEDELDPEQRETLRKARKMNRDALR